jgi:hypothetical protein
MRVMIVLFALLSALIVCSSLISAIEIDFDCPSEVSVDEEFECSLIARDFESDDAWDVKVELMDGDTRLGEIFDEDSGNWKSAYYYLYGVVDEAEKEYIVRLRVVKDFSGDVEGIVKLRKGSSREFFEFDLLVGDSGDEEEEDEEDAKDSEEEKEVKEKEKVTDLTPSFAKVEGDAKKPVSVINLNSVSEVGGGEMEEEKVVYESKNEKVRRYGIYGFALFLIFVLGVVLLRS